MTIINIKRANSYTNTLRSIDIFLDDKKIKDIKNNEIISLQIEPGVYTIHAKIDWCSSSKKTFQILEGEHVDFELSGFKYSYWLMKISLFLLPIDIFLSFFLDIYIIALILIIPFSIFVYYLSWGKRKYLNIELRK